MTDPAPVVVFAPDLMDRSRISTAIPDAQFVRAPDELRTALARVVLVDVSRPGVLEAVEARRVRDAETRVIGFGSHVDDELLSAARAAGCTEVMPRSRFFRTVADYAG